jgi:type IV secretory pathway VirB10-like protein
VNMRAIQDKQAPDIANLRAAPRTVMRLNRRTLAVVVGTVSVVVLGATLWSLQGGKRQREGAAPELHNVDRVSKAENLDRLPADYSQIAAAPAPPVLGPPLPGDLGRPALRAEREPGASGNGANRFDEDAHAERVNRIREADDAAKAPVVFKMSARAGTTSTGQTGAPLVGLDRTDPRVKSDSTTDAGNAGPLAGATDRKQAFLDRPSDPTGVSTSRLQSPASPYQVMAGTVIPAALITGINSDLPGQVIASVTESIYDSATGRYLLIPQGTRLIGRYDSQVSFGQRRVLLVWTRLILPDTSSIALDRLPGIDPAGYAGLEDGIDWHWDRILAGAALSTLLGVGAELAAPQRSGSEGQIVIATRQGVQDTVNEVGKEVTKKNLDVQPTLTIRPGFQLRVIVSKDMVLRPYQPLFFSRGTP